MVITWLDNIAEFLKQENSSDYLSIKEWDRYEAKMLSSLWNWCRVDSHYVDNERYKWLMDCKWDWCIICKEIWTPQTKYFGYFLIEGIDKNKVITFNKWTYKVLEKLIDSDDYSHIPTTLIIEKKIGSKYIDIYWKYWDNSEFRIGLQTIQSYDSKIANLIQEIYFSNDEVYYILYNWTDEKDRFWINFDGIKRDPKSLLKLEKPSRLKELESYGYSNFIEDPIIESHEEKCKRLWIARYVI